MGFSLFESRRPRESRGRSKNAVGWAAAGAAAAALCTYLASDERPAREATAANAPSRTASRFTVAGTGDFLLHDILIDQAAADGRAGGRTGLDFRPMLAALGPAIRGADLAVCHIETPLAARAGPFSGYPTFNSPPQIVDALAPLGYDTCSTASNHSIDQGEPGVRRTLAALDRAGIKHAGSARDRREARRVNLIDVKGAKIAHLSYTQSTNGIPEPGGQPWLVNDDMSARRILADAARAKAAGAEVVILSLHWGEEYRHEPTTLQRALAGRLAASRNVDLILGDHVHVVQPFEQINGKWVAYGMGNQVANPSANAPATHEGLIARFTFARDASGRWRARPSYTPTFVDPGPPIRLRTLPDGRDHRAARTAATARSLGFAVPATPDEAAR